MVGTEVESSPLLLARLQGGWAAEWLRHGGARTHTLPGPWARPLPEGTRLAGPAEGPLPTSLLRSSSKEMKKKGPLREGALRQPRDYGGGRPAQPLQ